MNSDGVYGSPPSRGRLVGYLIGPLTRFGVVVAVIACAIDQASKLWLLHSFDLARVAFGRPYELTSFLALTLNWNPGVSYGLFPQESDFGRYVLLGLTLIALAALWGWLAHAESRFTALALGLIIGGAVGNFIDRLYLPGVMDFVWFHVDSVNFSWYVFNLADTAIVAGVIGLLYEYALGPAPQKRPDPP